MHSGAFRFTLAMCAVIWGTITSVWLAGMAFTAGTTAGQVLEMTAAALIAYILFAVTLFRELWRDADKDRDIEAFKTEVREDISGLKEDVTGLKEDVREIKDMLKAGAPARGGSERPDRSC